MYLWLPFLWQSACYLQSVFNMPLPNPFLPSTSEQRNYSIPSWVLSVILHISLLVTLLINIQNRPAGQDETPGHRVGIILKETPQQGEIHQGQASEQPEETTPPLPSPSKARSPSILILNYRNQIFRYLAPASNNPCHNQVVPLLVQDRSILLQLPEVEFPFLALKILPKK